MAAALQEVSVVHFRQTSSTLSQQSFWNKVHACSQVLLLQGNAVAASTRAG
jgi:hypothetical protein